LRSFLSAFDRRRYRHGSARPRGDVLSSGDHAAVDLTDGLLAAERRHVFGENLVDRGQAFGLSLQPIFDDRKSERCRGNGAAAMTGIASDLFLAFKIVLI